MQLIFSSVAPLARASASPACAAASPMAVAATLTGQDGGVSGKDCPAGRLALQAYGGNNTSGAIQVAPALTAHPGASGRMDFETETFIAQTLTGSRFPGPGGDGYPIMPAAWRVTGSDGAYPLGDCAAALTTGTDRTAQLVGLTPGDRGVSVDRACAGMAQVEAVGVRRLLPVEFERLQGMPDDYTLVPVGHRGLPAKDGPRYRAVGNGMAVPVMAWIGRRIAAIEAGAR